MAARSGTTSSTALLEEFWRRHTFHDMCVEKIDAINRRVVILLEEYTLIITEVSKLTKRFEELPAPWLYHTWTDIGDGFALGVELESGKFEVVGRDLRLIRNSDMAVLIPK
jgi:hypothetical protein